MKLLQKYKNGNCNVSIFNDGTKVREYEGVPKPVYPESIDIKITDYCDAGCVFCHEMSTTKGKHCNFTLVRKTLQELPAGVELAIGGGNPLSHDGLRDFLISCKKQGLICNLTVNAFHVKKYKEYIEELREEDLIFGLGVSYNDKFLKDITLLNKKNLVIHLINGIHSYEDYKVLWFNGFDNFLFLGYKQIGRGLKHMNKDVTKAMECCKKIMPTLLKTYPANIAFDNLGLDQLNIKELLTKEEWEKMFMGDEGSFTFYIDFVNKQFAQSSTSLNRFDITDNIKEMFNKIKA